MKNLRTTPILWALTGLLAACGNTSTLPPASSNQPPEASIKLADGSALSSTPYLGPAQALIFGASDADGSVTKVHWVIDQGGTSERSGDFTGADVKGKINFTLPGLNSGGHTLNLTVTDNMGATGTASATFKVDAVAPTIAAVTVNGTAISEGQALSFASTDAATLNVSATDSRGGNDATPSPVGLLVYVGDVLVKTGVAPLTLDLTKLLSGTTGVSTVRIVAADSALNVSAPRTFTVQFAAATTGTGTTDSTPVLSWLTPSGDYVRGGGAVTLRASALKSGKDISAQVTYTTTCGSVNAGTWTLGTDCADGSKQTITASLTDGGKPYTITKTVTVDSSDPTVQLTSPQQGQTVTANPVNVTFAATDTGSGVDHVEVSATDAAGNKQAVGSVASASGTVVWAPQNGTYTLTATVYDKVGRTSTATRTFTVATSSNITPGAPAITASNTSGSNPQYIRGLGAVAGTASSTATITSAQLVVDGQTTGTATASTGSASFNFDFSTLNEGLHDIDLRWQDSAGTLTDSAKLSVFVDKTAPVVVWNTPTSGTVTNRAVVLSAAATDAASGVKGAVSYTVAGQPVTSPWTPAADGAYEVTASAGDGVGNVGTQKTTVTYDATAPVITATSPTNSQVFTAASVTIAATATDNLSGVKSIEATIQGPNDGAPITLGIQSGATYSASYTPGFNGTYTVVYKALDAAGNAAGTVTRTFSYSNSTAPVEGAPAPVISVIGSNPHSGNMTVNVNGNFDARSMVDRLVLQITDANGVVDNTSYVTTQANGTFSVDTTKLANGDLRKLEAIAYTKSNLSTTKLYVAPVTISNLNSPLFSVASPADGASLTTSLVPVKLTLTTRGTEYAYANTITVDVLDSRGKVALTKVSTSTSSDPKIFTSSECSGDNSSLTCNFQFDMAGLPADTYTVRARTNVTIAATGEVRPLEVTSRFTSNTTSLLPPAATVRFPAITNNRTVGRIDSSSGTLVNVSDDTGVSVVEARIVGPFDATIPLALNGTTQCQESVPVGNAVNVLLLNYGLSPAVKLGDIFLPSLDIDGSAYVPDNQSGQRYDLRVTTIDTDKNRNIQCIPVTVTRDSTKAERIAYVTNTLTTPTAPDPTPGKLNYTAGSWVISNLQNDSRVAGVVYINGVQQSVSFTASTSTSANVSINFADEGTYHVVWLVEDMTTGIVTSQSGAYISVKRNPAQ